jgi:hypothetical protein
MTNETNPTEDKTIQTVRRMTDDEMQREGWHNGHHANPPVLELSDGQVLYPSMDSERNGAGALFGYYDRTDKAFFVVDYGQVATPTYRR